MPRFDFTNFLHDPLSQSIPLVILITCHCYHFSHWPFVILTICHFDQFPPHFIFNGSHLKPHSIFPTFCFDHFPFWPFFKFWPLVGTFSFDHFPFWSLFSFNFFLSVTHWYLQFLRINMIFPFLPFPSSPEFPRHEFCGFLLFNINWGWESVWEKM